jgi:hypothetical protein
VELHERTEKVFGFGTCGGARNNESLEFDAMQLFERVHEPQTFLGRQTDNGESGSGLPFVQQRCALRKTRWTGIIQYSRGDIRLDLTESGRDKHGGCF